MSKFTIREVHVDDVSAVAGLLRTVLSEFGLSFGAGSETDAQVLGLPGSYRDHGGAFWVCVDADGTLVGTCGVFPLGDGDWELRKMYLSSATRGHGLGRRLLDVAVDWVRAHGGARVVLDTTDQMKQAIAFYESHGFVRDDSQLRGSRCHRGYSLTLRAPTP